MPLHEILVALNNDNKVGRSTDDGVDDSYGSHRHDSLVGDPLVRFFSHHKGGNFPKGAIIIRQELFASHSPRQARVLTLSLRGAERERILIGPSTLVAAQPSFLYLNLSFFGPIA